MTEKFVSQRSSRRRARASLAAGLAIAVSLVIAGCSSETAPQSGPEQENSPKVALLVSTGLKDSGLGLATQSAGDRLKEEYGADVTVEGSIAPAAYADALRNYASRGYELVIINDVAGNAAALEVAPEFPGTSFVTVNGYAAAEPNVSAVTFEWLEGGRLAGIVAGLTTTSNIVAGFGADQSIEPIRLLMEGFEAGVLEVNPGADVRTIWNGSVAGDAIKATQQANVVIGEGVDVIYGVANDANKGLFQAASDAGIRAMGYGVDENALAPDAVITSTLVDYSGSITRIYERFINGTLAPEVVVEGSTVGVWSLAEFRGLSDAEIANVTKALD